MAKQSAIEKNKRRTLMVARYQKKRLALKELIRNKYTSQEVRFKAVIELDII